MCYFLIYSLLTTQKYINLFKTKNEKGYLVQRKTKLQILSVKMWIKQQKRKNKFNE